jgi:hypothetical protein
VRCVFFCVQGTNNLPPQNTDRRPPTLLKQFTLLQSLPLAIPSPPSCLYLLPGSDGETITLITSPPLATFELEPLAFFDAHSKLSGLQLRAEGIGPTPEEESEISKFVRTPEGKGVGVIRLTGGEVWQTIERGSKMTRAGTWTTGDLIVVLNGGTPICIE